MSGHMTVKEAALQWGVTERRVSGMCREGRIPYAYKSGKSWMIPQDAERPLDGRVRDGRYISGAHDRKLPLPVGISDYKVASTEYYYVDKTMLIKEFLDERPMVSLFTRPRRFGKTLGMDMLRTFFEKTDEDTSVYFRNKEIWRQGAFYQKYQGKYPVIFVTFKDIKCSSWEETLRRLAEVIGDEFARHDELLASTECKAVDQTYFRRVMERRADATDLTNAFMVLTRMLHEHHHTAPVIIIDEYDTPIQQGHTYGFYDQVIQFMRNLFSGGLKDNKHLSFGFLTGILRVAKESIFSGLNNIAINSILDDKYSSSFGFTGDEVKAMAAYYGKKDRYDELCEWYDGYRFGNSEIFNPWSVINYFRNDCRPGAYWQSTGSNEIIREVLTEAGPSIYERLQSLLQGRSFLSYIDTDVIYPEIRNNPSSVYSFLLVAGYLKVVREEDFLADGSMCEVCIPNKEIRIVYKKEILDQLSGIIPQGVSISIQEALYQGDSEGLKSGLRELLLQSASFHDTVGENFYQGLMLGLGAMMDSRYLVRSNRESGYGRFDIQLMPTTSASPGILIELKAAGKDDQTDLHALAEEAVRQIHDRKYDTELKAGGIQTVFKFGVAFRGKEVEVVTE